MSSSRVKRLKTFVLMLLMMLVVLGFSQYRHILFCELVPYSSFHKLSDNIYVSPHIPTEHYFRIKLMLHVADRRISRFWGEKKGNARIIICSQAREYEKYCHSRDGAGCSLGTIYGNSFIVLSYQDMTTDVAAHEMCHIELFERLGWKSTTFDIPQWFNEGLSMMLDHRFVRATDSISRYEQYLKAWQLRTVPPARRLTLTEISSLKGFFDGDERHVALAYLTAATEVSFWMKNVGRQGLAQFLKKIESGAGFEAYLQTELEMTADSHGPRPVSPIRELEKQRPGG